MNTNKIDLFGGTGFIGSFFKNLYNEEVYVHPREDNIPVYNNILYMISTVSNYNMLDNPHKDIDVNLTKLVNVLKNCKDKDITFNFISSWFVYGKCRLPARENDSCDPTGFYSITKRAAEQLLVTYCEHYNIKYRILRLCNVYGDGDKFSAQKNAIQYMIDLFKKNESINLYEDGYILRDLMHVFDVCNAIKLVCENGDLNTIYNIGSGKPIALRYIIEYAKSILNSSSIINSIETPKFHNLVQSRDFYMDISKLNKLGFTQKISIEEGIKNICK